MPILNEHKCCTPQRKHLPIEMPQVLSPHWLSDFYTCLAEQLNISDDTKQQVFDYHTETWNWLTKKEHFFKELDRHVGEQSDYSLKSQLLETLSVLYTIFTAPGTSNSQKHMIASRIEENVQYCSTGFTNRVNFIIQLFNMPQNLDELIAQVRFNLVNRIASKIAVNNPQGIHVHNRVTIVARNAGFMTWAINMDDISSHEGSGGLSDTEIISHIQTGFANHFQLFALVNALRDELEALIARHGYDGKRELEHDYKSEECEKFCECIKLFIPNEEKEVLEKVTESGIVTDINWQYIKSVLLKKLRDENYVTFSQEENTLLEKLLLNENSILDSLTLNLLIPHGYELTQCLEYFSQWSIEQKAALVRAYLQDKSPNAQKEVLAILSNESPQLTAKLKKEPNLQTIYFTIAIAEKDVASVRTYIEQGEDINTALLLLFSQAYKSDTLYWLRQHRDLLKNLTVASMNAVIDEGKNVGKTIAETLVSTKKGRQLLRENEALKELLSQTRIVNELPEILKQAETERSTVSTQEGFFKNTNPQTKQLVQSIVYGDLKKSEALLKANSSSLDTLLTEKVTVIDYSGRKVKQKTAFQAALCAIDDELCAMLAKYMSPEELQSQYQDIFPKGHEAYYQAQTPFDFTQIVETISQSSDEDVKKALDLELPNDTLLWRNLEQFRADFTQHSYKEAVYNPQHLLKACALYDNQANNWDWQKRDLFWCQIIGFIQRFLPANSAMAVAQGLYNLVKIKQKPRRSFNFSFGDGSIFPLSFDSFSGLGYKYAVNFVGMPANKPSLNNYSMSESCGLFQNLNQAKTALLEELCNKGQSIALQAAV